MIEAPKETSLGPRARKEIFRFEQIFYPNLLELIERVRTEGRVVLVVLITLMYARKLKVDSSPDWVAVIYLFDHSLFSHSSDFPLA